MLARLEQAIRSHPEDEFIMSSTVDGNRNIAAMIDAMGITPEMVHGNVLLIGCGGGFLEGALISNDIIQNPIPITNSISKLVTVDASYIDASVWEFIPEDKISFYPHISSHSYATQYWDGTTFDIIFMLRVQSLQEQMSLSLPKDIHAMLVDDGQFVVTGNSSALPLFENNEYLKLERSINVGAYAYPYPFSKFHMGFVARKK